MNVNKAKGLLEKAIRNKQILSKYGCKSMQDLLKTYFWNPSKNKYCRRRN